MTLNEIFILLNEKKYDELIQNLNELIARDSRNPMYYFYRFLAYNHDYTNIDFNSLKNEDDLNNAFANDYSDSYLKEIKFFKSLKKTDIALLTYANHLNNDAFEEALLTYDYQDSKLFLTDTDLKLLEDYVDSLKIEGQYNNIVKLLSKLVNGRIPLTLEELEIDRKLKGYISKLEFKRFTPRVNTEINVEKEEEIKPSKTSLKKETKSNSVNNKKEDISYNVNYTKKEVKLPPKQNFYKENVDKDDDYKSFIKKNGNFALGFISVIISIIFPFVLGGVISNSSGALIKNNKLTFPIVLLFFLIIIGIISLILLISSRRSKKKIHFGIGMLLDVIILIVSIIYINANSTYDDYDELRFQVTSFSHTYDEVYLDYSIHSPSNKSVIQLYGKLEIYEDKEKIHTGYYSYYCYSNGDYAYSDSYGSYCGYQVLYLKLSGYKSHEVYFSIISVTYSDEKEFLYEEPKLVYSN